MENEIGLPIIAGLNIFSYFCGLLFDNNKKFIENGKARCNFKGARARA